MLNLRRAGWTVVAVVLLGLVTTAFTKPIVRPAPRPSAPPAYRPPTPAPPTYRPPGTTPPIHMPGWPGSSTGSWPRPTYRPPAQVQADIARAITTRPSTGIAQLRSTEARRLSEATRLTLAREAVHQLSLKIEQPGDAVRNLAEVRTARRHAADLQPEIRTSLERLSAQAERHVLSEGIQDVQLRAERGKWSEAAEMARTWLERFGEARTPEERALESAEFRKQRAEVRETLREMHRLGQQLDSLTRLDRALRTLDGTQPGEQARALAGIAPADLPPSLRRPAEALRGLAEVRAHAAERWARPPNVRAIQESVARLERGLIEVPQIDANLGKRLLQDLAVKAFLEGHAPEYFKLMPEGAPGHAAELLRDMKAMALGEGKVESWPAAKVLPSEPGRGPESPRAPPGLEPLVPEGARQSWKPPVRESARADLPPLEKVGEMAAALKAKAEAGVKPEKATLEGKAERTRSQLARIQERVLAPEKQERMRFSAIEAELDRRLSAAERIRVRALLDQKRSTQEIAVALAQQGGQVDEDDEFIRNVEARLGGTRLDREARSRALRLKRQGRTAAEVADILRM